MNAPSFKAQFEAAEMPAAASDVVTAPGLSPPPPRVRRLGTVDYEPTWRAMRELTAARAADTPDEIWLLGHPPVYTLGVAGRSEHRPRGAT